MNKVRIRELNLLKAEAEQKIEYLEYYCEGQNFCNVIEQKKLIEDNKQVIKNIEGLTKKLQG